MRLIQSFPPMLPTRPCKYCFSMQGGSVFADFDIDQNHCLYLVRISFDGYGCCHPDSSVGIGKIDNQKSKLIIKAIEGDCLETVEVIEALKNYFRENKAVLWEDALTEYGLI